MIYHYKYNEPPMVLRFPLGPSTAPELDEALSEFLAADTPNNRMVKALGPPRPFVDLNDHMIEKVRGVEAKWMNTGTNRDDAVP